MRRVVCRMSPMEAVAFIPPALRRCPRPDAISAATQKHSRGNRQGSYPQAIRRRAVHPQRMGRQRKVDRHRHMTEPVRNVLRTRESSARRAISRWAGFPKNLVRDSRERPAPNTRGGLVRLARPPAVKAHRAPPNSPQRNMRTEQKQKPENPENYRP